MGVWISISNKQKVKTNYNYLYINFLKLPTYFYYRVIIEFYFTFYINFVFTKLYSRPCNEIL